MTESDETSFAKRLGLFLFIFCLRVGADAFFLLFIPPTKPFDFVPPDYDEEAGDRSVGGGSPRPPSQLILSSLAHC